MTQTPQPQSAEDRLREKIVDWEADHHICDDEGYGCEIEQFTGTWPGATGVYTRCKLKREAIDAIMQAVTAEIGAATLKELEAVKDKSESHLNIDGKTMRRAYLEDRIAELRNHFGIGGTDAKV